MSVDNMREMTLLEVQQQSLNMMLLVRNFCEERGLRYYLAYGSLLGAIRHGGFIPWDDDADFWMPRSDFDEFVEKFEPSGFYRMVKPFQQGYTFSWAKIVDERTAYSNSYSILPEDYGLSMDVFPLDNDAGKWHFGRLHYMLKARELCLRQPKRIGEHWSKKQLAVKVVKAITPKSLISDSRIKQMFSSPTLSDRYVNYCSRYSYEREAMDKLLFGDGRHVLFAGEHEFLVPKEPEKVLSRLYGVNWMEPVVDDRHARVFWR